VIFSRNTPYQRIVLTKWKDDLRLFLNSHLQFSSRDEYRYHEALVHPGLAALAGRAPCWCWAAAMDWRSAKS
jgi:spermidine synthase